MGYLRKEDRNARARARYVENGGHAGLSEDRKAKKLVAKQKYRQENSEKCTAVVIDWQSMHPKKMMLSQARTRAKASGIPCSITEDDFEIPGFCPVLGIKLSRGTGAQHDGSPSLDRMDSSRGYEPGNVSVISWRANSLKKNATIDELKAIVRWMDT